MALEDLAHDSGADLGGGGGGGGAPTRIHGTSFPKVAGVHVPIGDGVYSNRGWRKRRRCRPKALPKVHR